MKKRTYMLLDCESIACLEKEIDDILNDTSEVIYHLYGDLIMKKGLYYQALYGEWVEYDDE